MKKRWFIGLAALLVLGLMLVACQGQVQQAVEEAAPTVQAAVEEAAPTVEAAVEAAATEVMAEEPTEAPAEMVAGSVGVVLPTREEPRWIQDETRFQDAFDAAGYDVEILFSEGDPAKERANVEDLITKGVQVIILTPQDGAAAGAAAEAARDAGVKVIAYDRLILNTDAVDYYVTFDSIAVGEAQGQYLVDHATGTGNPLFLYAGAATDNNAFLFFEGAWNVLQPKIADGTFVIKNSSEAEALQDSAELTREEMANIIGQITTDWDFDTAKSLAEANLTATTAEDKGDVFILAPNDGTARAIADAFAADADVSSYVVTGQDAEIASVQYIIDGKQSMTVLKDVRTLVADAIAAAVAYLEGGAPEETTTYNNGAIDVPAKPSEVVSVDQSNVVAAIIDSGYWPADEFTNLEALATAEEVPAEEEMMPEGPAVVSADGCDYGGKIESIVALDAYTVEFNLCRPDPAFLAKAAFTVFGIQPSEHIDATAASGELLENPVGTGAYQLDSWNRGDSIIMSKFADYWGDAAIADTLVFRWATESASRLLELQSGAADYITNLAAADFATVEADPNLELVPLPAPNILYFGMTNTFEPFDNVDVRRAIGMGIDRQRIVDNFFPEGSEVASHFVPCGVPGGCEGEAWYDFDPEAARQLLADAGYPDGFETTIYYRDVFRDYLPEPGAVAVELQTQLSENLGITAEVEVMESGQFIDDSGNGRLNGIHLLGWTGDYPHPTNFLDYHFSQQQRQFGDPYPEIYEPLAEASSIADPASANALYEQANNAIRDLVPMVPIAHGAAAYAARAGLPGMNNPPFGAPIMRLIDPGKDTLVYVKNAEPISLYCADETDGESLDTCQQVVEALYRFDVDGNVEPALAEECSVSDDGLVWTCNLRQGVKFHDGSDFEAADVIASYGAGIDASNPNHVGNTGSWEYFATLWDGLMNVSE